MPAPLPAPLSTEEGDIAVHPNRRPPQSARRDAVFERLCPGSVERMKTEMDGERLACTMGFVGGVYTTAGYAHLADVYLLETAENVGAFIAEAMGLGRTSSQPRARRERTTWF